MTHDYHQYVSCCLVTQACMVYPCTQRNKVISTQPYLTRRAATSPLPEPVGVYWLSRKTQNAALLFSLARTKINLLFSSPVQHKKRIDACFRWRSKEHKSYHCSNQHYHTGTLISSHYSFRYVLWNFLFSPKTTRSIHICYSLPCYPSTHLHT